MVENPSSQGGSGFTFLNFIPQNSLKRKNFGNKLASEQLDPVARIMMVCVGKGTLAECKIQVSEPG